MQFFHTYVKYGNKYPPKQQKISGISYFGILDNKFETYYLETILIWIILNIKLF